MRKGLTVVVFAMISSFAQGQTACTVFDHQELKEMEQAELVAEYCMAWKRNDENIVDSTDLLVSGNTPSDMYSVEASKCRNEAERIGRALGRKGITASYESLCKK